MREAPSRGRGAARRMGAAGAAVGGKSRWKPSLRWYDPDQVPRVGHSLSAPKGTPRLGDPLGSIQVHGSPHGGERQPNVGSGNGGGRPGRRWRRSGPTSSEVFPPVASYRSKVTL